MRPALLVATMTLVAGTLALAPAQDEGAPSPFAAPSEALAESPVLNPFASPATTADNPFATPGDAAADPFASAPAVNIPIGAPAAAAGDPFVPAAGAPPADDPFGATSPFVTVTPGAAAPATGAAAGDPFATTPSTGAITGAAAGDPFATTAGSATASPGSNDPFSTAPTATEAASADAGTPAPTNPDGVTESGLTEFRYARVMVWDGREVVARRGMTVAEAKDFDQARRDELRGDLLAGRLPNYTPQAAAGGEAPGGGVDAWVAWAYYYEQLEMWAEYTENVGLAGSGTPGSLMEDMQWPGVANAAGAGPGAGPLAGGLQPTGLPGALAGPNPGLGSAGVIGGGLVGGLSADGTQALAPGQSPTDRLVTQVISMYERAQDELVTIEDDQNAFMDEMMTGIEDRANARDAYKDWREARQQAIEDFLNNDWRRRYEGEVAMVGGVRYELYRPGSQPSSVPRDVRVVVTDTMRLTPFDLIDEKTGLVLEAPAE